MAGWKQCQVAGRRFWVANVRGQSDVDACRDLVGQAVPGQGNGQALGGLASPGGDLDQVEESFPQAGLSNSHGSLQAGCARTLKADRQVRAHRPTSQ